MNLVLNWIKLIFCSFKMSKDLLKGVVKNMKFTKDSPMVKSALLLLGAGVYESIEDVPNILNLREAVLEALMN